MDFLKPIWKRIVSSLLVAFLWAWIYIHIYSPIACPNIARFHFMPTFWSQFSLLPLCFLNVNFTDLVWQYVVAFIIPFILTYTGLLQACLKPTKKKVIISTIVVCILILSDISYFFSIVSLNLSFFMLVSSLFENTIPLFFVYMTIGFLSVIISFLVKKKLLPSPPFS